MCVIKITKFYQVKQSFRHEHPFGFWCEFIVLMFGLKILKYYKLFPTRGKYSHSLQPVPFWNGVFPFSFPFIFTRLCVLYKVLWNLWK